MAAKLRMPSHVSGKISAALESLPIIDERRSLLPGLVAIFVSLDMSWLNTPISHAANASPPDELLMERSKYSHAIDVATLVAHTYLQLTGNKTISFSGIESNSVATGSAKSHDIHEPFLNLMTQIFDALQLPESPEYHAARAAERFKGN